MHETAEIGRITRTLRSGVITAVVAFAALTFSVNARAQSSVQQLRLIGYYSLLRGSQLVGVGSREPTFTVALGGEVAWTGFVARRIGIDGSIDIGESTTTNNAYYARLESALFTPIFDREGPRGYAFIVGAGGGISGGDRFWWAAVRAYPYAFARVAYSPSRLSQVYATWGCAPIDTSLAAGSYVIENRVEVAAYVGYFSVGARARLTSIQAGDPSRTYGELDMTFFLGIGVRLDEKKKKW